MFWTEPQAKIFHRDFVQNRCQNLSILLLFWRLIYSKITSRQKHLFWDVFFVCQFFSLIMDALFSNFYIRYIISNKVICQVRIHFVFFLSGISQCLQLLKCRFFSIFCMLWFLENKRKTFCKRRFFLSIFQNPHKKYIYSLRGYEILFVFYSSSNSKRVFKKNIWRKRHMEIRTRKYKTYIYISFIIRV